MHTEAEIHPGRTENKIDYTHKDQTPQERGYFAAS